MRPSLGDDFDRASIDAVPPPQLSAFLLEQPSLPRYRAWEWDAVASHLGRSVLEIGAGMGVFSEQLAGAGLERLVLGDTEDFFLARLEQIYAGRDDIEIIRVSLPGRIDLEDPVESAVAMNVLEHIEDDVQALRDVAAVVVPGGTIVLWVPAYMQLYGNFDRKLGHVRRYTPRSLRGAVERAELTVRLLRPINLLGGLAWWAAVRRGRVDRANPRLARIYDSIVVPASRTIERAITPPFGQSLLCVTEVRA